MTATVVMTSAAQSQKKESPRARLVISQGPVVALPRAHYPLPQWLALYRVSPRRGAHRYDRNPFEGKRGARRTKEMVLGKDTWKGVAPPWPLS